MGREYISKMNCFNKKRNSNAINVEINGVADSVKKIIGKKDGAGFLPEEFEDSSLRLREPQINGYS